MEEFLDPTSFEVTATFADPVLVAHVDPDSFAVTATFGTPRLAPQAALTGEPTVTIAASCTRSSAPVSAASGPSKAVIG